MKHPSIQEIFNTFIDMGIWSDPRGKEEVEEYLLKIKRKYKKLDTKEQEFFDTEYLSNPYHDSTIYCGDKDKKIKKVIVWIDVEWPELLLVHEYNKKHKDAPIDLVIGHHPVGKSFLWIAPLQKSISPFVSHGVWIPIGIAEKIQFPRIFEVEQRLSPLNHQRALKFAEMLDIPYLWVHTPADNCCFQFLRNYITKNQKKLKELQDIIDLLLELPEMRIAKMNGSGPKIWNGEAESRAGKIEVTGITGGTEASKHIYKEYTEVGISTILEMHMSADHLEEAKKAHLNVIMTDHMASDSLGMNILMDSLEEQWVEILDFSGFTRCSRVKSKK